MTQEEFESRIELVITTEEYEAIGAAYMAASVDKDKFIKCWLKWGGGGIQALFDQRLTQTSKLLVRVKHLEAERKEQVRSRA
jgi:hypothetical protein